MPPKRTTRANSQPPAPVSPTKRGRGRPKMDQQDDVAATAPEPRRGGSRRAPQVSAEQAIEAAFGHNNNHTNLYDGPQLDPALEHEGQLESIIPQPIPEEELHDHSNLSGATVVNNAADLPLQLRELAAEMPGELPGLESSAAGILNHLAQRIRDASYIAPVLANLDTDVIYQKRQSAFELSVEWFKLPEQLFIDTPLLLRVLMETGPDEFIDIGPWRPDTIFAKANLAQTLRTVFALNPLDSNIAKTLQDIDHAFCESVLTGPAGFRHDDWDTKKKIVDVVLEFMLDLRTQTVLAQLRSEAHSSTDFSEIVGQAFFMQGSEDPIPFLPDDALLSSDDVQGYQRRYTQRVRDLKTAGEEATNESQLVDADKLAERFTWEILCASTTHMSRQVLPILDEVFASLSTARIASALVERRRRRREGDKIDRRLSGLGSSSTPKTQGKKGGRGRGSKASKETKSGEKAKGIYKDTGNGRKVNFDAPLSQIDIPEVPPQTSSATTFSATQDHGFGELAPELGPTEDVQEAVRLAHVQEQVARRQKRAASPGMEQSPRKRQAPASIDHAEDNIYDPAPNDSVQVIDEADDRFMTLSNGNRVLRRDMAEPPMTQLESIRKDAKMNAARYAAAKRPQTRTAWTPREENRLLDLISAHGCGWSTLKKIDEDSLDCLNNRSAEDCRLKARNIKFDYLKSRAEKLPQNFENVVLNMNQKKQLEAMGINYEQARIRARTVAAE